MELIGILTATIILVAGIIYMEYRFAKMNDEDDTDVRAIAFVAKCLQEYNAKDLEYNSNHGFHFRIEDESYLLDLADRHMMEVMLQNRITEGTDMEIVKRLAREFSTQYRGCRILLENDMIYTCGSTIVTSGEAFEDSLAVILPALPTIRDRFVDTYGKELASKQHNTASILS